MQKQLPTYLVLKYITAAKTNNHLMGIQGYLSLIIPTHAEKSRVANLDVMDAIADNRDTLMLLPNTLHKEFIIT